MFMDIGALSHEQLEHSLLPDLHAAEQARYRNFTHPQRRRTWLAGRALLLASLARHLEHVEPGALRTDPRGAVRYDDCGLHLSLSHSRELLVAAVSQVPVGVDIESRQARTLIERSAQVFSDAETGYLRELSGLARVQAFYALWTLKEAACKLTGVSLWESLRSTCFDLVNGGVRLYAPFSSEALSFMIAGIEPGWQLALAMRASATAPRIGCWRMSAPQQWHSQTLDAQRFLHALPSQPVSY